MALPMASMASMGWLRWRRWRCWWFWWLRWLRWRRWCCGWFGGVDGVNGLASIVDGGLGSSTQRALTWKSLCVPSGEFGMHSGSLLSVLNSCMRIAVLATCLICFSCSTVCMLPDVFLHSLFCLVMVVYIMTIILTAVLGVPRTCLAEERGCTSPRCSIMPLARVDFFPNACRRRLIGGSVSWKVCLFVEFLRLQYRRLFSRYTQMRLAMVPLLG